MVKFIIVIAAAMLGVVLAEPPVANQYLLPSSSRVYRTPARFGSANGQSRSAPSTDYGVPEQIISARGFGPSFHNRIPGSVGVPSVQHSGTSDQFSSYEVPLLGYSTTTEDPLAEPANYQYAYAVQDNVFGSKFGLQEKRQDENAIGEYRVVLPDGRTQIVEYEANELGYNANIRYEEPNRNTAASNDGRVRDTNDGYSGDGSVYSGTYDGNTGTNSPSSGADGASSEAGGPNSGSGVSGPSDNGAYFRTGNGRRVTGRSQTGPY